MAAIDSSLPRTMISFSTQYDQTLHIYNHFSCRNFPTNQTENLHFSSSSKFWKTDMEGGYQNQNHSSSSSSTDYPLHLIFFFLTLMMFVGFSWYMNYESVVESVVDQVKLVLIVGPVLVLLVLHWLPNKESFGFPLNVLLPERESLHRAGGTPWGVGLFLVILLFMVSYQPYFHERWFPLLNR